MNFSIRRYAAISAILLALLMTVLDVTLVNIALPDMGRNFGVPDSSIVWVVTIYQLTITMLLLPVSSMGDLYSYRRSFLTGMAVFTLASAGCALSANFTQLIIARAVQGFGAACIMGVNIALTRLIYPRHVLGRGLALNAMVIAIATAAGPTIAGGILSVASWHWLFLLNIPFGIAAFIIGKRLLPSNPPSADNSPKKFDWISAIENIIVFGLIIFAVGNFAHKGNYVANTIMLIAGLATAVLYIRRQFNRTNPMFPVDLFRIRLFTLSIFTSVCSFIAQIMAMVSLPFLFVSVYRFNEITTGLLMTPWPLATMIISPIAARIIERRNPGVTAAVGMAVFSIGLVLLYTSGADEWNIAWKMAVCGIGYGLFQTPNNVVMVMCTPVARTGDAGGMQSTARLVGQTFGATFVTLVFALPVTRESSIRICLCVAMATAVLAGILSLPRRNGVNKAAAIK